MSSAVHLNDDVLERYAMSSLSEAEAEAVEDHIALCSRCLDRLDEATTYIEGMRAALKNGPEGEGRKVRLPSWIQRGWGAPVWAGGALAAAGLLFVTLRPGHLSPSADALPSPALVVLDGTRGASSVVHGAGPFDFELFMPADGRRYHVELLDDGGRKLWDADVPGLNGKLHAVVKQKIDAGQYYLHVTEPVSGSQHDYAVRVEK
jgi:hypothetical protein